MKKNTLILIFMCLTLAGNAQTFQIYGKVADEKDNPVEFADVLLLQNNMTLQYQMTDETGKFIFNTSRGKYSLLIRQLGDTLYNQNIDIVQNVDLGIIKVQQNPDVLQAAVVTAEKKIFERKIDRMVFNVVDMPSVEGGDVMDVLKITPGLMVSNSSIEIIGKSGVDVMINGRPLQLSGEDLLNFLRGLRSSDIQSIEVITTPPAKYEAEGNSGLVNIILKKIENNTWSASVFGNYYQAKYAEGGTGGSFNYRKKNLSFYLNSSYYFGKEFNDSESTIFYPELRWESKGNYTNNSRSINAQTGFDVEITDKWTVGAQYMGRISRPKPTIENDRTDLFDITSNAETGSIITKSNRKSKSDIHSGNLHSIIKLDTLGRKINFDFDILTYNSNSNSTYAANTGGSQYAEIPNGLQSVNNILDRKMTNYAAQIDVEHPFKKFSLNYGMKLSFSQTDNDIHVFDLASGIPVNDPNQTNRFLYRENVQALYVSGSATLGKWEIQLGLRGENTQFTGNSVTKDTVFKKSYFELFPTAYITYNHNDKNILFAEYGRRISRPNFDHLNPFRSYSSPYYSFEGNPELRPILLDNISIGYVYDNKFMLAFDYSTTKDNSGGGIVLLDTAGGYTQRGIRLNYFDDYSIGARIVYIFRKLNWWTSSNSVGGYYEHSDSKIYPLTPKTAKGYSAYFQTSNTFYFNKDRTISAGFDFTYMPSQNSTTLTHNFKRTNLNAFLRMLFFDKTLSVSLNGNNLLNEYSFNWRSERSGMLIYSRAHYDLQYIRLSVSYSFGSKKVKVEQREVSNSEERGRMN